MTARRRTVFGPKLHKRTIPCGYCFERWAECYDHINPVSNGGTNAKKNLYPACMTCNSLLHNLVFSSLDEKREYVKSKLKERNEWHSGEEMQHMREKFRPTSEMASILWPPMPLGKLGKGTSENHYQKNTNAICPTCGGKFSRLKHGLAFCGKKCLEIAWLNKLMGPIPKSNPAETGNTQQSGHPRCNPQPNPTVRV